MTRGWRGPEQGEVRRCRHCPRDIVLRAGAWVDSDGIAYCMKRGYDPQGALRAPLLHEPMPDIGRSRR